jgi:hypothetical protein
MSMYRIRLGPSTTYVTRPLELVPGESQEYPRGFVHDGSVPSCPAALTRRGKPDMQNVSRISFSVGKAMAVLLISMLWITACHSEPLRGRVGSSSKFYSGWIDLQQLTDFHRDDILKITVDRRGQRNLCKVTTQRTEVRMMTTRGQGFTV